MRARPQRHGDDANKHRGGKAEKSDELLADLRTGQDLREAWLAYRRVADPRVLMKDEGLWQVVEGDQPIRYFGRTRLYYQALAYERDYVWAAFDDVPFRHLARPLELARIALITTARPIGSGNRDGDGVKRVWSAPVVPAPSALNTDNLAWDNETTHASGSS